MPWVVEEFARHDVDETWRARREARGRNVERSVDQNLYRR